MIFYSSLCFARWKSFKESRGLLFGEFEAGSSGFVDGSCSKLLYPTDAPFSRIKYFFLLNNKAATRSAPIPAQLQQAPLDFYEASPKRWANLTIVDAEFPVSPSFSWHLHRRDPHPTTNPSPRFSLFTTTVDSFESLITIGLPPPRLLSASSRHHATLVANAMLKTDRYSTRTVSSVNSEA